MVMIQVFEVIEGVALIIVVDGEETLFLANKEKTVKTTKIRSAERKMREVFFIFRLRKNPRNKYFLMEYEELIIGL